MGDIEKLKKVQKLLSRLYEAEKYAPDQSLSDIKVTGAMIENWLGEDYEWCELMDTLALICDGHYSPNSFKNDVLAKNNLHPSQLKNISKGVNDVSH
tara:strand:- start:1446 stop:1736 length:291 start_codon:yes stop_codon:yes gene_type:complete